MLNPENEVFGTVIPHISNPPVNLRKIDEPVILIIKDVSISTGKVIIVQTGWIRIIDGWIWIVKH